MEVGGISRNAHTYASSGLELLVSVSRFSYNHRSYHEPCLFEEKLVGLKFLKIMSKLLYASMSQDQEAKDKHNQNKKFGFFGITLEYHFHNRL